MSDREHIQPLGVRYIMLPPFNADGTIDGTNPDGWVVSAVLEELLLAAKEQAEEHGVEHYIYECKPILRVMRGKVQVKKVSKEAR